MAYRIVDVHTASYPSDAAIDAALGSLGLSVLAVRESVNGFVCQAAQVPDAGYQQFVAQELERYLDNAWTQVGALQSLSRLVSPALNEKADLVVGRVGEDRGIYVEIEFRPNVEKDLVKFQIAWNRARLSAAVLILALDRNALNARYTTMPEFAKVQRIVAELSPPYPLLLVGIHGEHVSDIGAQGV